MTLDFDAKQALNKFLRGQLSGFDLVRYLREHKAALERIADALNPREVMKCRECICCVLIPDGKRSISPYGCVRHAPHPIASTVAAVGLDFGCAEGIRRES